MKKYILALTIDVLFFSFIGFLFFLIVLRFFMGINYALIFSVCLSLIVGLILTKILYGKTKKKSEHLLEDEKVEYFAEDFLLKTEKEKSSVIYSSLKKSGYTLVRKKGGFFIVEKNILLFIKFGFEGLKKSDIVLAYNSVSENETAVIFIYKIENEVSEFLKRFDKKVCLLDKFALYKLLEKTDLLPIRDKNFKSKPKFKSVLNTVFDKKRAVKYLLFGLAFLLLSFLVRYKIYYLTVGFSFLVLSVITRIYGKNSPIKNDIEL